MKKWIALFLTLAVMLAGLLGIALADSVPQIGKLTVGDDGTVTLEVTGDDISSGCIYFHTPAWEWAGYADLFLDAKTGLLSGKYDGYSSYPDAVASLYFLYKGTSHGYQYTEDNKTRTEFTAEAEYEYDENRIPIRAYLSRKETVGELIEWTYKPKWAEKASECRDYATTSYKEQTEERTYTEGELTLTTTDVKSYKVKLIKTPEDTVLDLFFPSYYSDYELISAERNKTEKGVSVRQSYSGGEEIKISRVVNRATTYTATEMTSSEWERKYVDWQEDTVTGSIRETREGNTTQSESESKEGLVYLGDDIRMTTQSQNTNYYDKGTGNLTQSETSLSRREYHFEEYSYVSDGKTYKNKTWRERNNHNENQTTYYNDEGERTSDRNETSVYEYNYVERKYNNSEDTYHSQQAVSYVNDTISHNYYANTQAVSSETVSHNQWTLGPSGTARTEQYTSNTKNYSSSGAYTGKHTEERTRIREKGEEGSDTRSDGWAITESVSNEKLYNKNDILTYEYTATENKNTENSSNTWYSTTGKVTETRSAMTDKKNGTSSSINTRFNTYTGKPTYVYTWNETKDKEDNWKYSEQFTYNNDDGSLRRKIVNNPDGSVIYYNSSNQVAAQKDADGMWTDGAGNKIGPDIDVNIRFKQRTGEIDGYSVSASSENESTYTWYVNGKIAYEEKTVYRKDGTVDHYEDGILRRSTKGDTTSYFDRKGKLTSSVKYDSVKSEMSEFDSEGKLTRIYDERGNETRYSKAGKVLYSRKEEYNEKDGVNYTVYYDGEGKEFARLYNKEKYENKDDGGSHTEFTTVRIAGYYDYGAYGEEYSEDYEWWDPESATGKLEEKVRVYDSKVETDPVTQEYVSTSTETSDYTKWTVINGSKTAEVTRSERNETQSGDGYYEIRTYRDGVLTNEYRSEDSEDGNTSKMISKSYNAQTGKQENVFKAYYERETPFTKTKTYDRYDNLQKYGIIDNTDSWNWEQEYYANGARAGESWYDDLDGDSEYYARYYLNGNKAYENSRSGDNSRGIWYHEDGSYGYWSETNDGTTTTWEYDAKGNLTGIRKNERYEDGMNSYEQWDAEKLLYTITSGSENGRYTETFRDPEGNMLVYSDGDCTLTLAAPGDGWQSAFGGWFYLENGAPIRDAWKQFGSEWYYFDSRGRMTTGVVGDGSTVYAMEKDGTLSDGGWTETASGWTYTNADGVVTTGWQQIDGKWYYFSDGWYFNESEYKAESEWVQDSYRGIMQTGATKIWNSDWQTQHTYFFNEDGTWDNSPGWKSTNGCDNEVEYHYYDENGTEVTGWKNIGGKWYYFNEDGVMRNGWVGSGSTWYYMEPATGEMATGWVQEKFEDDWFHMDASGVMQTGWQQIDGKWYYFKDDGKMAAGEWVGSYYMDENGVMATGWVKDGGKWYYTNAGGVMQTGWQQIDGSWYYFKDNGAMAAGEWVGSYYMGADGKMSTGWVKDNGKWFYLKADGIMWTGWLEDGGSWYYLYSGGGMATGQAAIDGRNCIFDAGGVWLGYAD